MKGQSIIKQFDRRKYTGSHCFYCGEKLRRHTEEHVFPLWLQRRFKLQNQTIYLLNGTTIKYSQLKVPCCRKCNNEHLSGLEKRVARHLRLAPKQLKETGSNGHFRLGVQNPRWNYLQGKIASQRQTSAARWSNIAETPSRRFCNGTLINSKRAP